MHHYQYIYLLPLADIANKKLVYILSLKKILMGLGKWDTHLSRITLCCVHCAKALQSCLTLCDPMGSSVHGDSPGKNTGVGCHVLFQGIFLTQRSNLCLISPALAGSSSPLAPHTITTISSLLPLSVICIWAISEWWSLCIYAASSSKLAVCHMPLIFFPQKIQYGKIDGHNWGYKVGKIIKQMNMALWKDWQPAFLFWASASSFVKSDLTRWSQKPLLCSRISAIFTSKERKQYTSAAGWSCALGRYLSEQVNIPLQEEKQTKSYYLASPGPDLETYLLITGRMESNLEWWFTVIMTTCKIKYTIGH